MKKSLILCLALLLLVPPLISSLSIDIQKQSNNEVMIDGVHMPTVFTLNVKNNGFENNLFFYHFFGEDMFPADSINFKKGESKVVEVGTYPRDDLAQKGKIDFNLFIQGDDKSEVIYPLSLTVITLDQVFEIGAEEFKPDSNTVTIYIKNLVNFDFNELTVDFESPFFKVEEKFPLAAYEKETFEIKLNKEDFRELMAGFYTLNAKVTAAEKKVDIKGIMQFTEKDIVTTSQNDYGLIINTKTISKTNEGNVVSDSSTIVKKNIISRLFTTFNPEPSYVERKGVSVYYTWEKELKPGETQNITVKTNWVIPMLTILLIIAIVIIVKQLSKTSLDIKKKVNFVRAKGGEFALKVSVIVNAKRYVEKVNIIDRLPPLVKLHEKFGGEMPTKIDERTGRLEWALGKLQQGETRIFSYIIYSKVGVLGKFALPTANAVYERDGEVHEAESNHAFFIADQVRKDREE